MSAGALLIEKRHPDIEQDSHLLKYKKPDREGGKPGQAAGSFLLLFHCNSITAYMCNVVKRCAIERKACYMPTLLSPSLKLLLGVILP